MKKNVILSFLMLITMGAYSQVKVGDNPTTINANALLELESTNKGVLLPRVALTASNSASPLSSFVAGMLVYNTATAGTAPNNVTPGVYFCNGTAWISISSASNWVTSTTDPSLTGNTGTLPRFVENTVNGSKWYIDANGVAKLIDLGNNLGGASALGEYGIFNSGQVPPSGYLRQGTGPYNVADYPTLGKAFALQTFTATPSTNAAVNNVAPIIGFGNGLFVVFYGNSTGYQTSADNGATWTTRTLPIAENWTTVHYANGVWLATGTGTNRFIRSTDGINWTQGTFPNSRDWYNFAHNGTVWLAVAYGTNQAATSPDGITWTNRTLPTGTTWYAAAASPGIFVLPDYSAARVARSTDNGVTWSTFALPLNSAWNECVFANNKFVAISSGKLITGSADGLSWVERTIPLPVSGWKTVVYSGTAWLAFAPGASSEVAASTDGAVTWAKLTNTMSFTGNEQMAASGNGVIVLVSGESTRRLLRATLAQNTTFTVPAVTEPSGSQLWIKATETGTGGLTLSSVKTANFTALANFEYPVNTSSGALTVTLPANPTIGQRVSFIDYANSFSTNNLTVNFNGSKYNGATGATYALSYGNQPISFVYLDATQGWKLSSSGAPTLIGNSPYTPNFGGIGSPSDVQFFWRRSGDMLIVTGKFTAGTVNTNNLTISIPAGLTLNTSLWPTGSYQLCGSAIWSGDGSTTSRSYHVIASTTNSSDVFITFTGPSTPNTFAPSPAQGAMGAGHSLQVKFEIPITQWTIR